MEDIKFVELFKRNLPALRRLIFNLDDYIEKSQYDALHKNFLDSQSNFEAQIKELKSKSELKIKDLEATISKKDQIIGAKDSAINFKEMVIKKQKDDIQNFKANYSDLENAFNLFKMLPDNVKFALAGVFGDANSPIEFLSGALSDGHMDALFDYIATSINNSNDSGEIDSLQILFDFVFYAVNIGSREATYQRLEVNVGDEFDSETMKKISDSAQIGAVKEIFIAGYKFDKTGKIVKQSLVLLE